MSVLFLLFTPSAREFTASCKTIMSCKVRYHRVNRLMFSTVAAAAVVWYDQVVPQESNSCWHDVNCFSDGRMRSTWLRSVRRR